MHSLGCQPRSRGVVGRVKIFSLAACAAALSLPAVVSSADAATSHSASTRLPASSVPTLVDDSCRALDDVVI